MVATESGWEHFYHQADIGIRGWGPSRETAFAQIALALSAVITDLEDIHDRRHIVCECTAPDNDFLLLAWINQVVYEMSVTKMIFRRFDLEIKDHHLRARLGGEPVDVARHQPAVEVKGATLTELRVHQNANGTWIAQCVVDV
ncbi:MAG: archease [Nitrospira sp.]|nr:archease [Nitrospira sp.]